MTRNVYEATSRGLTVLAPNAELAAALSGEVERLHVDAGHEVWPTPRIRDYGGWLRELYAGRHFKDASLPRLLTDVEERELWRRVILDGDAGVEFLEPSGAARAARRATRAMADHGIPPAALSRQDTDETRALVEWSRRYERHCREIHCIGVGEVAPLPEECAGLAWLESPIWRPTARAVLAAQASLLLHPPSIDASNANANASALHAVSAAGELAAIAAWIRDGRAADSRFRAWICIPDLARRRPQVEDAFDAVLAPQRYALSGRDSAVPYAVAGGTPLADHGPVVAALSTLSAAAGAVPFADFSALLRLPALHGVPQDAAIAARLDLALRQHGPDSAGLEEWLRLSEQVQHRASIPPGSATLRLGAFNRTMRDLGGDQRMSRWVSLWVTAFEHAPWADRNRWSSTEFQAAERFRELLAALATGDAFFGALSASRAAGVLRRAAQDTVFQPRTGIPPVWVSGQLMDPWLTYDGLWVTGCSEDRWPPPLDPVPLLPIRLQREFGVVGASSDAQLQQAEDLQRRWRARAAINVFSCADTGDGQVRGLSPLLPADCVLEPSTTLTQPHWRLLAVAPAFEFLPDAQAPPFAPPERTRGVATLKAQSLCGFRGFAESRLRTDRLQRPVPGFNARERGELLHDALERIWLEMRSSAALLAASDADVCRIVRSAVTHAIAQQTRRRDPGMRWREREAPRLEALLLKWLEVERLREPFEVEHLEQEMQKAHHGGLEFNVRIDRIDRLADGGRVLIDYKSGMAAPDWRGDRPDNPQLPIYALLRPEALVAVAYGRVNAGECAFVPEAARGGIFKPRGRPTSLEGMPDFGALVGLWSGRIERLAGEFAAGAAHVDPTLRACASCSLQPLCRIPAAFDDMPVGDE